MRGNTALSDSHRTHKVYRNNPLPVFTRVLNEALRRAEISSVVDENVRRFSVGRRDSTASMAAGSVMSTRHLTPLLPPLCSRPRSGLSLAGHQQFTDGSADALGAARHDDGLP